MHFNVNIKKSQKRVFLLLVTVFFLFYWSLAHPLWNNSNIPYLFSSFVASYTKCPKSDTYYTPVLVESKDQNRNYLLESHPNLPNFLFKSSKIISLIPDVHSIRWSGIYWQESWRSLPKFLLYSAHYDEREFILWNHEKKDCGKSYVRILAVYDGQHVPDTYSCLLYFNSTESPVMTPVYSYDLIDWQGFSPDYLVPYLISCALPPMEGRVKVPIAVSLVQNSCTSPSNILKVIGKTQRKNGNETVPTGKPLSDKLSIGVCGPALYYYKDFSHRLIEWLEIMLMLEASKVILYRTVNHPNVEKVLDYYEQKGKLKTVSFRYPPPYVDDPRTRIAWTSKERNEMFALENIYFSDCILRFKDEFQYIAHFDPDEVPFLMKHKTLGELLQYLRKSDDSNSAYYHLKWKSFYPELPLANSALNISKLFYILSHSRHPKNLVTNVDNNGKSIYDTSQILAVYSHRPLLYVNGKKDWYTRFRVYDKESIVSPSVAYTGHFRYQECGSACNNEELVEENVLLERKEEIISRVNFALKELKLDSKFD